MDRKLSVDGSKQSIAFLAFAFVFCMTNRIFPVMCLFTLGHSVRTVVPVRKFCISYVSERYTKMYDRCGRLIRTTYSSLRQGNDHGVRTVQLL
jgi:hypothetical protein